MGEFPLSCCRPDAGHQSGASARTTVSTAGLLQRAGRAANAPTTGTIIAHISLICVNNGRARARQDGRHETCLCHSQ